MAVGMLERTEGQARRTVHGKAIQIRMRDFDEISILSQRPS